MYEICNFVLSRQFRIMGRKIIYSTEFYDHKARFNHVLFSTRKLTLGKVNVNMEHCFGNLSTICSLIFYEVKVSKKKCKIYHKRDPAIYTTVVQESKGGTYLEILIFHIILM